VRTEVQAAHESRSTLALVFFVSIPLYFVSLHLLTTIHVSEHKLKKLCGTSVKQCITQSRYLSFPEFSH